MAARFTVLPTANFGANLHSLREFLAEQGAEQVFDALLGRLFDEVVPNLASFPRMGRDFLALEPLSDEAKARLRALKLRTREATEVREYISGDYLILYALRRSTAFLLSIRHHRQLSFDLRGHWL